MHLSNEPRTKGRKQQETKARLRSLLEDLPEGIVVIAPDGQIIQANPAAERILGVERTDLEGHGYPDLGREVLRPDGTPRPPEEMAGLRALREEQPISDVTMGIKCPDDGISWVTANALPIKHESGQLEEVVISFTPDTQPSEPAVAYDAVLESWIRTLETHKLESKGHTQRTTKLALRLARKLGVDDSEMTQLQRGALLHDIGMLGVSDSIWLKPGKLTEKEWDLVRRHPVYACELLWPSPFLRPALDIPYCHHERWNGTGYPRGLEGEQIPLAARIFTVADVYHALQSDRPHREARPPETARSYIRDRAGAQFDPQVVEAFLD